LNGAAVDGGKKLASVAELTLAAALDGNLFVAADVIHQHVAQSQLVFKT
jgi:hypothetical protein